MTISQCFSLTAAFICSDYFNYLHRMSWFSLGPSKSPATLLDNRHNLLKDFSWTSLLLLTLPAEEQLCRESGTCAAVLELSVASDHPNETKTTLASCRFNFILVLLELHSYTCAKILQRKRGGGKQTNLEENVKEVLLFWLSMLGWLLS